MQRSRRIFGVQVLLSFILLGSAARSETHFVDATSYVFNPANLTVQKGDTVTWRFPETFMSHTSTSQAAASAGGWDSGLKSSGEIFSHTMSAVGSFPYYCTPHQFFPMTGNVDVILSTSAAQSSVNAVPTSVPANGTSASIITVTLRNINGFPVSGRQVELSQGGGTSVISPSQGSTDPNGIVSFSVRSSTIQTVTYTARDVMDGIDVDETATVAFACSALITAPGSVCPNATGRIASVEDAGAGTTYDWTVLGGTLNSGQGTPSITFSAAAMGSLSISVDVMTTACSDSSTVMVPIVAHCREADFNDDGYADLLWRNSVTGQNSIWFLDGAGWEGSFQLVTTVSDPDWSIAGSADFDSDGDPDILWRNLSTGQNSIWLMDGSVWTGSFVLLPAVANLDWGIGAIADFDDDGDPDLAWRNRTNGQNSIWLLDGTTWPGDFELLPAVSDDQWVMLGAADFDRDGQNDLLWRNFQTGLTSIWFLGGTHWDGASYALLPVVHPSWSIGAIADYDRDGDPDLMWRHSSSGQNSIWQLQDGTWDGTFVLLPAVPNTDWKVTN